MQEASSKYADASRKLLFTLGHGASPEKEHEVSPIKSFIINYLTQNISYFYGKVSLTYIYLMVNTVKYNYHFYRAINNEIT